MPIDFSDPRILRFMTECYETENAKRTAWFISNREKLEQQNHHDPQATYLSHADIRRTKLEKSLPMVSRHFKESQRNRRKKVPHDGPVLGMSAIKRDLALSNLTPEPKMKPVEEDIANILRTPQPEGGRRKYLEKRARKIPEDRYNFCETSNNVYGWGFKDSKSLRFPSFGRIQTYHRGSRSRTGPQPDPAYYQPPLPLGTRKC